MTKVVISEAALPYLLIQAREWREQEGHSGGVVVIYNGEVAGWMDSLRDPDHWCPGCLAVSKRGGVWRAHRGDEYTGAREWVRVLAEPDAACAVEPEVDHD